MTISHAGAVAFREHNGATLFLVVSSSDGAHWVLPKGHIEAGESPETAAIRELKEEAGVIGRIDKSLSIQKFRQRGREIVVKYFLVSTLEVQKPDESRMLRWEDEQSASALLSFKEVRAALREGAEAVKKR